MRPAVLASRASISALALHLAFVPLLQSQQPEQPPRFKVESNAVVVDVLVTDRKGHPIPGLTERDFKVYEDDSEQQVTNFSPPLSVAAPSEKPNVATADTAATPPGADKSPRFITIVLDLADSQPASIKRSCDTVLRYLEKADLENASFAIYYVTAGLQLALPFTSDLKAAEKALDDISRRSHGGRGTGGDRLATQEQLDDLYRRAHPETQFGVVAAAPVNAAGARSAPGDPFAAAYQREIESLRTYLDIQNTFQAKALFVALRALALSYADVPGRKNIALFSEGLYYADEARQQLDAVIDAANHANVSFYVIDPAGLSTGFSAAARGGSTRAAQMTEIAGEGIGQRGGESKFDRMRAISDEISNHEQLGGLAEGTGGLLIKNTNDLGPAFARVLEDSRNYYTLVYQPANKDWDGTFRKIRVALSRDGYQLRYRQGYWAIPRGQGVAMTPAQAHLFSSARRGLLKSSFTPAMQASIALAGDGKFYAPLSVALPADILPTEKDADQGKSGLMLVAFARDLQGNVLSTYEKHWEVRVRSKDLAANKTLVLQGQMPLPQPQPLKVQTIIQLPKGGFAVAEDSVDWPQGSNNAPILTSLFLTDQIEPTKCEDRSEALCVLNVRIRQPARAEFAAGKLMAYVAASNLSIDPETKQPRVGAEFTVRNGDKVVGSVPAGNVQAIPGPNPDSVLLVAQLNLKGLPAGNYTLEAKAHDFVRKVEGVQKTEFRLQ